ncbi:Permease of the major facilitator superfamily [Hahella chejuensis KCTC 2396]|uniref:Permease of the major facilitator superfamily n=1 Tax=Hahella chejuensis (strain KCTC 2396) TaxID=349521 RepID=Q2SIA2_HAHCH|nr:MFS transporter [Hahella chejuensis]ABC29622.1 Permease of the major facilitator superfamily [Hahella chejuensis KCTC 2396]
MNAVAPSLRQSSLHSLSLHAVLLLSMTLPMLILYAIGALGPLLIQDLGIEPGWLGYVTLSAFGVAAVLSLAAGPLVERLGSRRGLLLLFVSVALAYGLMITLPGFAGIIAAVAVCGVAQALSNPVTNLLIAQRIAPPRKAFAVGLKQSGVQLGALIAGGLLPLIAVPFGWRAAIATIIPVALLLAVTAPALAPPTPASGSRRSWLPARPGGLLLNLMAVQACAGVTLSAFVTFLPVFATQQGVSQQDAGLMVAAFGLMGVMSRLTLTSLSARLQDESWMLLGLMALTAIAIGVTQQADPDSHWRLWAGVLVVGLTAVATNAVAMGMLLRDSVFGTPATASGLLSAAFFGGFAAGAPLFGAVSGSSYGFSGAWSALVVVALAGSVAALGLALLRRRSAS